MPDFDYALFDAAAQEGEGCCCYGDRVIIDTVADLPSEVMRMVMRDNAWQLVHPEGATA